MIGALRDSRGLTLTEILVVISIISVTTLVGQSVLQSSFDRANVAAVADEVAAALRYARSASIGTSHLYKVSIDDAVDTLLVERLEYSTAVFDTSRATLSPAEVATTGYVPVHHPIKRGFSYWIDFRGESRFGNVDIVDVTVGPPPIQEFQGGLGAMGMGAMGAMGIGGGGVASITFDELGRASEFGTITIGRGGDTVYVVVDTFSGRVSISD